MFGGEEGEIAGPFDLPLRVSSSMAAPTEVHLLTEELNSTRTRRRGVGPGMVEAVSEALRARGSTARSRRRNPAGPLPPPEVLVGEETGLPGVGKGRVLAVAAGRASRR